MGLPCSPDNTRPRIDFRGLFFFATGIGQHVGKFLERVQQKWKRFCGSDARRNNNLEDFRDSKKSGNTLADHMQLRVEYAQNA
ncbi:hypothetical protein SAMN05428936_11552 [Pelagibacterium halotolerans]|nr:hypothetical protein SAMN05428936_11552 [Pelagibacterium halotolerans]